MNEATGALESLSHGRHELLAGAPRLELFRAPTDNDGIKLWSDNHDRVLSLWQEWGLDRLTRHHDRTVVVAHPDSVVVTTREELRGAAGAAAGHERVLTFLASGDVVVDDDVTLPATWTDVARVGHSFLMPPRCDDVTWYGFGPGENEPDRHAGSLLGRWHGNPDELPYLMPQDFGTRTGVRWFSLAGRGAGLLVVAVTPEICSFSATHHTTDDLHRATDWLDLVRRDEVVVHVDVARRGVGTASCGPDTLARYRVTPGRHRWRWRLRPYDSAADPAELVHGAVR